MILNYTIKNTDNFITVKEVLKAYFNISDRLLLRLKNSKSIFLNNLPTYVSKQVNANDTVTVIIDFIEIVFSSLLSCLLKVTFS